MEDVSLEEKENQANIQLLPPQKKSKITAESSLSEANAANQPQPLIPNQPRHKIYAHTGQCNSVLFLNNSDYVVSGGKDSAIKIWDARYGAQVSSFEGFQGAVCDMAISRDNRLLVAGLTSRDICVWDFNSGQTLHTLKGHQQKVCAVDISKFEDEYLIISAAPSDCIKIWSLQHDYPLTSLHFSRSNTNAICFADETRLFCSGHDDGKIMFFTIDSIRNYHRKAGEMKVHSQSITSIRSLQNGNVVMSSGRDNLHNLIDVRTMQVCRKFKTKGNNVANNWIRTCVSPDENFAAICSADGIVSIWSIQMGRRISDMKEHNAAVLSCAWSGLGNSFASADNDGMICIWS